MVDKDKNRHQQSTIVLYLSVFMAVATVGLAIFGKITPEYNFALGAILGFAGNYVYQNYRTAPRE